jgi:IMP dehydrogenase/GMP reductase
MHDRIAYQGITFDDVLLEPGYSDLLPHEADTRSQLTARIGLNIPILSSPMDTVTEAELAIALAQEGGLGVIHKNMSIPDQTREVDKVKRSENGIIAADHAGAQYLGGADHRRRLPPRHPHPARPPLPRVERPPHRRGHDQG